MSQNSSALNSPRAQAICVQTQPLFHETVEHAQSMETPIYASMLPEAKYEYLCALHKRCFDREVVIPMPARNDAALGIVTFEVPRIPGVLKRITIAGVDAASAKARLYYVDSALPNDEVVISHGQHGRVPLAELGVPLAALTRFQEGRAKLFIDVGHELTSTLQPDQKGGGARPGSLSCRSGPRGEVQVVLRVRDLPTDLQRHFAQARFRLFNDANEPLYIRNGTLSKAAKDGAACCAVM